MAIRAWYLPTWVKCDAGDVADRPDAPGCPAVVVDRDPVSPGENPGRNLSGWPGAEHDGVEPLVHRPTLAVAGAHAAQQERWATSRSKVWAASLKPSLIVR